MTALWTPADLRAATGGMLRTPFAATGVSIDTRTLQPGDRVNFEVDTLARYVARLLEYR
jgi:hypothetical protein